MAEDLKNIEPFDYLRVTRPLFDFYSYGKPTMESDEFRNALYYVHHYQYKNGDLLRAILGREVIHDREWEADVIKLIDDLLLKPQHFCKVFRYIGNREFSLRGIFWRWNDWTPRQYDWRPQAFPCSIRVHSKLKKLIYVRRVNDRVDVEGEIRTTVHTTKNGVLTMSFETWQKRYAHLFKEVRLEGGNERTIYQRQGGIPWHDHHKSKHGFYRKTRERLGLNSLASTELSSVSKADRGKGAQETSESVSALPAGVRGGVVSKSWRILEDFRGTTLEEWRKRHPEKLTFGYWKTNAPS